MKKQFLIILVIAGTATLFVGGGQADESERRGFSAGVGAGGVFSLRTTVGSP